MKFVSYQYKEFITIMIIKLLELTSTEFITFFSKKSYIDFQSFCQYIQCMKDQSKLKDSPMSLSEKGDNSRMHMDASKFVVHGIFKIIIMTT